VPFTSWSQIQLADTIGLTRSSIANLEAGRQRPPVHVTLLIAQALDVPVDVLLPSGAELDKLVSVQAPQIDLQGQSASAHDFVTMALRRAAGE
jgi:transcriptional regulator with XRE-family HTH domain